MFVDNVHGNDHDLPCHLPVCICTVRIHCCTYCLVMMAWLLFSDDGNPLSLKVVTHSATKKVTVELLERDLAVGL